MEEKSGQKLGCVLHRGVHYTGKYGILFPLYNYFFLTYQENERMVRGKIKPGTNEQKQKELLEPTTMLFGELAEKNG